MPRNPPGPRRVQCQHRDIYIDCSTEAQARGFSRPTPQRRLAAATYSGQIAPDSATKPATTAGVDFNNGEIFPGPLVLPDEALAVDPDEEPQSFKSWETVVKKYGLAVSHKRNAIYVIGPPEVTDEVRGLMSGWEKPCVPEEDAMEGIPDNLEPPRQDDLCEYLGAFYHGMSIKKFKAGFRWVKWSDATKGKKNKIQRIGLATPDPSPEVFGIRHRPSPDGIAKGQVNLNDIIDAMIPRVPSDAHAIVMMLHQDLYEDEDDDFCCGRAYGASRVCLVTSFRYHPSLDLYSEVDLEHMWPASHCKRCVDILCSTSEPPRKKAKGVAEASKTTRKNSTALGAAISAANGKLVPETEADYKGLWFSRTARTISHELGHCLTLGHCVYFACVMQGTASVAEDVRQPPYCCPVCVKKLATHMSPILRYTGQALSLEKIWVREQHEAMSKLCRKWSHVGMFAGLEAWLEKRLDTMEDLEVRGVYVVEKQAASEPIFASTSTRTQPNAAEKSSTKRFARWLNEV